jgi:hypothetical protein
MLRDVAFWRRGEPRLLDVGLGHRLDSSHQLSLEGKLSQRKIAVYVLYCTKVSVSCCINSFVCSQKSTRDYIFSVRPRSNPRNLNTTALSKEFHIVLALKRQFMVALDAFDCFC